MDLTRLGLSSFLILLMGLSACTTVQLPRKLTRQQLATLDTGTYPIIVGIDRKADHSDELYRLLRGAAVFHRVAFLDELAITPDLVATPVTPFHRKGTATIPIFSAISLGIIPTIVNEPYELAFRLTSPEKPTQPVDIHYQAKSLTVLGWVAGPLRLTPNWASGAPGITHDRLGKQIALILISNAEKINQLTGKELIP